MHKRSKTIKIYIMNQEQRKRVILKLLESNEAISIQEIVSNCQVSEVTIRRDLALLEKKGMLKRIHGGAVRQTAISELFGFDKGLSCHNEKEASITHRMAEYAEKVYLLCDSSKIEKLSYYNYSGISLIDFLVTDNKIDPSVLEMHCGEGIRVITPRLAHTACG